MPARVDPCLATLVDKPPKGPDWAYEVKWDGYRIAVHIEPGRTRILTRGGYDWTDRFPSIVDDARRLAVKTAILDGEAVVLDEMGRSDFGMLQRALGRLPSPYEAGAIVFYAFDLLYLDGRDLRRLPLRERRGLLDPLVDGREGAVPLSERCRPTATSSFALPARTASKVSSPSMWRSHIAPAGATGGTVSNPICYRRCKEMSATGDS
jgi:bifunctional non-homologous end joining protein LigD